jgi:hypothetical protein
MVIQSPAVEIFKGRYAKEKKSRAGAGGGAGLSSPPLCLSKILWFGQNFTPVSVCNTIQHFVGCFLNPGIRLMKFAGRLGSKLAKHITVP